MNDSALNRWRSKIEKNDDGCWIWAASLGGGGYGKFFFDGAYRSAHRWGWEALVGPIPTGLDLDHLCRNRRCVNPDHLEPVTHRENIRRGMQSRGRGDVESKCPSGHVRTSANTRVDKRFKSLVCRDCAREALRRHRARVGSR
ncbi:HNH endonuclease signature motif containing protein [Microbacterium soli]|uniref:HNH nuclease domain-containing protein n=1 Tax=Microbacterium soli TaxID=446075 RepID=A0ABP7NIZ6_9MICO